MNTAAVTNLARSVWGDLRDKRLWPVALVLMAAVVAVPVLLLHSSGPAPAPIPVAATGAAPPGIPAVGDQTSAGQAHLPGHGRDPFGGSARGSSTVGAPATTGATTGGSATAPAKSSTTSGSSGSTSTSAPSTTPSVVATGPAPAGGAPPPPPPARKPSPPTAGLSPLQSYGVSVSMTNASGGVNEMDSIDRLTLLPSAQQPLLAELGVLQGGHRVLFAVAPGAVLRGPGTCVPGPIDCEVMSLAPDQIESVSTSISTAPAAMFMITDITAVDHGSRAAAQKARQSMSLVGRQFLGQWSLQATQLFPYDSSVGALVDLRNLTVGG